MRRQTAPPLPPPASVLVVSNNQRLVDELRRLAAITGCVPLVVGEALAVRPAWATAPVVLVGDDMAGALSDLRLPRRHVVVLVTPSDPEPASWRRAVEVGAQEVASLRGDQERLVEVLGAGHPGGRAGGGPGGGTVIAVTGACGGAGASVFAAALAATAQGGGQPSVLVDVDPWGGGADLLVGGENVPGLRWPDLAATSGRISAASLREVLPVVDDLAVLSWGRAEPVPVSAASMHTVLTAARHGHRLVVADVGRRDDEATVEALALATSTVLVVPAHVRAVAAARTRLGVLRRAAVDVRLVVCGSASGRLDADEVSAALELQLVASMRPERRLDDWLDQGLGPIRRVRGPLARACAATLAALTPQPSAT